LEHRGRFALIQVDMAALPTYLPFPEAARKYGLAETRIKSLIESSTIKAAIIGEDVFVAEAEVQNQGKALRKEDLPEWKKHAHLKWNPNLG